LFTTRSEQDYLRWTNIGEQTRERGRELLHTTYQQPATFNLQKEVHLYILYKYNKYLYNSLLSCLFIHQHSTHSIRAWQKETKANREMTVANPDQMKSVMVHEEVPKEHASVKPVRGLRKRHRG
jgi:hypothetical protein